MSKNSSRRSNDTPVLGRRHSTRREALRHRRSRQWLFEQLEDRRLLATLYVDNPLDFTITNDQGAAGLDSGDEVTWTPGAGSAHGASVPGLVFGTDAFSTIQSAITAAAPLDTIRVAGGSFVESINVSKQLTLLGNQNGVDARDPSRTGLPATETVVGNTGSTSVNLTASDAILDGFTIEGATLSASGYGVLLGAGTAGSEVRNNIIQDNITGLSLANNNGANPAIIERNVFRNNNEPGAASGQGIYTDEFNAGGPLTGAVIDNNTFAGHTVAGIGFSSTTAASPASNITLSSNLFDANGQALYAFNLINSQITTNTFQNATDTGSSDVRLMDGVSGIALSGNLFQNGVGRAFRVGGIGIAGLAVPTNVSFNLNSVTGYTGAVGSFQVDADYAGTLDATLNWWGDITGPTTAANPGGVGTTIADPDGAVDFQPWLVYGTDASPTVPGFQLPASYTVPAQVGGFTTTNNNYRRLVNMIEGLQPGQTVTLSGDFDWTEPLALAAWALGNDGVVSAADDYSLLVRQNLNNVTITAASLGTATIQGPGDLSGANLEGVFVFDGGDNQNWVISNLEIFDFDLSIGMFNGAGGTDAYNNTQILNNHIRIPADLNIIAAPVDTNQNIGIHYSFGTNQTIQGNIIDIAGGGVSNGVNFSSTVGMQSNTSGGAVYDGLLIDGNTLNVIGAQSAAPASILGIWENAHAHSSDITVSNNDFLNLDAGNNPALNLQRAFRVTSHSSATTTVTYSGNTVAGANIGFQWLAAGNFAGNQAVRLWENTLTDTGTAVLLQSNGVANLYRNTITGSLTAAVSAASGSLTGSGPVTNAVEQNFITGGGAGIVLAAGVVVANPIFNNDLSGNTGLALDNQSGVLVDASGNWWGSNTAAGVVAETSGLVDYTPWLDVGTDTAAGIAGFQGDFSTLHVDDTSPQASATGRIQEAIDLATGATPTVLIEAGIYAENVAANKAGLVLAGASGIATDVVIDPPGVTDAITVSATGVTIRDLSVTGAANAIVATGVAVLTLENLQLTGNTSGGVLTNVVTVNFTASTAADTIDITDAQFSATNVQALTMSGTTTFNAFGDDGSDTFNVTPSVTMTVNIDGDLPTPPATPGDTLNVITTGTGNPTLTSTSTPNGLQGSYTFSDRATVNFQEIESLGTNTDLVVTKTDAPDPVTAGTTLTYTITLENVGGVAADGVSLTDVVPAGTTFVSFTAPVGWTVTAPAVGGTGTVTATNTSVAAGSGPITFTLVVAVNASTLAGTVLSNTATATTTTPEDTTANNTDTETTTVIASADLSVTKTDSSDPVTAGTNLTYTIVVTNNGVSDAQSVSLSDLVPAGTTFVSFVAPAGWAISTPAVGGTGTVSATIPTLAAGSGAQTFTLIVSVGASVANATVLSNTATVASTTPDAVPANNSDTETTAVAAVADISVTKTDNADPINAGQNLTYTIVVTNNGPSDAQGVSLSDLVPAGTTFVSFTTPAGWTATTPAVGGTGTVGATIATLAAGSGPQTFTLVVAVSSAAANGSVLSNTAAVTTTTTDTVPANNSDTEITVVLTSADLSVTKTDSADPVVAGQNLTYTIVVTNNGTSDAQGVNLSDLVPAGTTFVSFTAPAGWTSTTPAVGGTGAISSTRPTLAAGSGPQTFTLVVLVGSSVPTGASVTNTAVIGSTTSDPVPGNNSDTETTATIASADLSVTKTDTPDPVIAGQNITYTIVVTNNGTSDAQGVSLTDLVPAGATFVSFVAPAGWTSTTPAVGGTGTVTSTIPTLAAGASATFTLVVGTSATAANGTIVSNTATVASTTTDPTPANNTDTETTTIVTSADLSLTKTDNADPVTAGQDLTYTIVVTNLGVNDAQGVSLTDIVPAGTTFVSFTAPAGWTITTPAVGGTGTVTATRATLPAGSGAQTFTFVVRVPASTAAATTVTNTATVSSTTADPVPANNTDTETTTVIASADVSVTKTDNADPVVAGQNLTYTIVVSNLGLSDAQGVSLNDLIPAGTTFVSFTAPAGWTSTTPAVGGTGTVTSTRPTVAAGAVATFTLVVRVDPAATSATVITNTATVSSTSTDPNSANNTDTETTAVAPPGLPGCEVVTLNVPGAPGTAVIVSDADSPGQFALVITGTSGIDVITVDPRFGFPSQVTVRRNGLVLGNFSTSQFQKIVAFGQAGSDYIAISSDLAIPALLFGGNGNDQLLGGRGNDGIDGGNGIDFLFGGAGNDTLCGGNDSDVLYGQAGNDTMGGDEGIDTLFGDGGNDLLLGGDGIDFLYAGSGNDRVFGEAGNDVMHGEEGNDIVSGGTGSDVIAGGADRDLVLGGAGADLLLGEAGDDIVIANITAYDTDEAALNALLAEWISSNSYTNRVNNLRAGSGANSPYALNSTTVTDDGQADLLWGLGGQDWFLFGIGDSVLDKAANELVN